MYLSSLNVYHQIYLNQFQTSEDESIQKTTEQFVNNLQVEFPSTVSTIFRTGEKISEKTLAIAYCLLCQVCVIYFKFFFFRLIIFIYF